ncbi:MAG: SEC-C domain-containing protein, partial [Holosporales bacterium]|nr:SEC-C domain-containing protein [Holosporales bacterium]
TAIFNFEADLEKLNSVLRPDYIEEDTPTIDDTEDQGFIESDETAQGSDEIRQSETFRNAPCPCGSGKRYKHCCGKLKEVNFVDVKKTAKKPPKSRKPAAKQKKK